MGCISAGVCSCSPKSHKSRTVRVTICETCNPASPLMCNKPIEEGIAPLQCRMIYGPAGVREA